MNHSRDRSTANAVLSPASARRLAVIAGSMVVLASLVLAFRAVLPVFSFPHPGGPYAIGTITSHFTDTARPEVCD